jgi:uncharacterized protein (DUF58 family)
VTLIPTRRWLAAGALLALVAPLGLVVPEALATLLVLDAVWLAALLADALLVESPERLEVEREAPAAFSVGHALPVAYRWRQPAGARGVATVLVREALPEILGGGAAPVRRLRVPTEGWARESLEVAPVRRGKARAGRITLRRLGPLGMVWRQGTIERPWEVTVYPRLAGASLRALPAQAVRRREAGLRNVRRAGEGRLFEGLREWVPGDDTRIIDWKATARRRKLIARQYEDERRQQVLLVIDAGRLLTAEIGGTPRLESAIEAALHLAHAVVEHDDNVGVMIFADEVLRFVAPARGRRALRAVLDALAGVEGRLVESDYPLAFRHLAARNRKRALTVLFTDVVDRTASDALVAQAGTLRPRHLPLAVTLRDTALEAAAAGHPATESDAFRRAAAEELLRARDEALAEMRGRGVLVLDVDPAGAGKAVVERYHQLKRRGAL